MVVLVLGALLVLAILALTVRDLLTAVIVVGLFSLLASLFFFVLHAPDVALTEAAVGTGIGSIVFVWIVFKTRDDDGGAGNSARAGDIARAGDGRRRRWVRHTAETVALVATAAFLLAVVGAGPSEISALRGWIVDHGPTDTGAVNLVTAIYLGYRAFDTLGETIVLLLAVGGVTQLVYGVDHDQERSR